MREGLTSCQHELASCSDMQVDPRRTAMQSTYDVVVLGGGPAGLSAALTLGRARRRVLVVDGGEPRNRFASHMHTVLGHEGTDPAQLLVTGRAEVARYGVEVRTGRADAINESVAWPVLVLRGTVEGDYTARAYC